MEGLLIGKIDCLIVYIINSYKIVINVFINIKLLLLLKSIFHKSSSIVSIMKYYYEYERNNYSFYCKYKFCSIAFLYFVL